MILDRFDSPEYISEIQRSHTDSCAKTNKSLASERFSSFWNSVFTFGLLGTSGEINFPNARVSVLNIEFYKVQYVEIQKLLNDIEKRLLGEISEGMDELLHELASFSARLKLHLNFEENLLYPTIKSMKDEGAVTLAEEFKVRTIDLKNHFKKYYCKWTLPSSILQEENLFRAETEKLIFKLRDRIRTEENEIYVLF